MVVSPIMQKYMNHAAILSFEAVLQDMTGVIAKGELEATDVDTKPEESLFYKDLQRTLAEAVEALGDKERLVVSLYYYEELKYSEIAEVMGIGQSRVSMLLLGKSHIGEVQVSLWDDSSLTACDAAGVMLL